MAVPPVESTATATTTGGSSTTSLVCDKPTGTVSGDLLIAFMAIYQNETITPPAGWTSITSRSGSGRLEAFRKEAGGSEGSTYTFVISGFGSPATIAIHRISGQDATTPVNTSANDSDSSSPHTLSSLTTSANDTLILRSLACFFEFGDTLSPPAGYTELCDITTADSYIQHSVGSISHATAGSTGTADFTSNLSPSTAYGISLAIAPTAGGGGEETPFNNGLLLLGCGS